MSAVAEVQAGFDRARGLLFLGIAAQDGGWLRLALEGRVFGTFAVAEHGVPSLDGQAPFAPSIALPLRAQDLLPGAVLRVERLTAPGDAEGEALIDGVCPELSPAEAPPVAQTPPKDFAAQFDTYVQGADPAAHRRRVAAVLGAIDALPLPAGAPAETVESCVAALACKELPSERLGLGAYATLPLDPGARAALGQRLVLDNFTGPAEDAHLREIGEVLVRAAEEAALTKPHRRAQPAPAAEDGSENLGRNLVPILSLQDWAERDEDGAVQIAAGEGGHAVFGPYLTLPDGAYALHVCLRTDPAEEPEAQPLLSRVLSRPVPELPAPTVVAEVVDGADFLGRRELDLADLSGAPVAVAFDLSRERQKSAKIETRLYTCGSVPLTLLSLFIIAR